MLLDEGLCEFKRSPSNESTIIDTDIDKTLDITRLSTTRSDTKKHKRHSNLNFFNPDLLETEWSLVKDYIHFTSNMLTTLPR